MTEKRFAELKYAITNFPHVVPTVAEAREMIDEIGRLRGIVEQLVSTSFSEDIVRAALSEEK